MEGDPLQEHPPISQRGLAILLPEETGVGQSRPQDPLVAAADRPRPIALGIGHREEPVHELARSIPEGEVSLVVAHGGDEDLRRQIEVGGIELARDHDRPLHQVRHLLEKLGVPFAGSSGRRGDASPGGAGRALERLRDRPPPLRDICQDAVLTEHFAIGGRVGQRRGARSGEAATERLAS